MQIIFTIGFLLQIIVSIWSFINLHINNSNILILVLFAIQSISALVFFFSLKKEIWTLAHIFSVISSMSLIVLILKAHYPWLEILSFIPLVLYYALCSVYCSYKSKMNKLDKKIKENQDNQKLSEDE